MIELKLQPYCHNCGAFVPETSHQELSAGYVSIEHLITVYCENAEKCANLYDHIQKSMEEKKDKIRENFTPLNGNL